jgi:hypothetical protein
VRVVLKNEELSVNFQKWLLGRKKLKKFLTHEFLPGALVDGEQVSRQGRRRIPRRKLHGLTVTLVPVVAAGVIRSDRGTVRTLVPDLTVGRKAVRPLTAAEEEALLTKQGGPSAAVSQGTSQSILKVHGEVLDGEDRRTRPPRVMQQKDSR